MFLYSELFVLIFIFHGAPAPQMPLSLGMFVTKKTGQKVQML